MTNPKQHDEATAALYFELDQARQLVAYTANQIVRFAGVKEHRFGKETARGWGSEDIYHDFADAFKVAEAANNGLVEGWVNACGDKERLKSEIEVMDEAYTGWSRFFLVTSSQGHIHSSMRCSTCFNTTTYGWLPELSGKTEGEAVDELGPSLCTHCFAGAPSELKIGLDKISGSKARQLAWSPDRDAKIARREAERKAKAEAKAKKAANALKTAERNAVKINKLVDRFGEHYEAAYRWTWDVKGYDTAYSIYHDMLTRNRNARRAA